MNTLQKEDLLSQNILIGKDNSYAAIEIQKAVFHRELPIEIVLQLDQINDELVNKKILELIERKKKYEKNILKNAIFAVNKSKSMRTKLAELKKLTDIGIILSSVWDIGNRDNYAGNPNFYGNAPTQVVEQCVLRLTKKRGVVLDSMAGSGTTIDVCKMYNRRCIAFDLSPTRKDIIRNDSKSLPLVDNSVDLIFLHPPYWNMVKYSNEPSDLSNMPLGAYFENIEVIVRELQRVLKVDGYLCILIGDVVRGGKYIPLTRRVSNICEKLNFEDCGTAIKITKDSVSQRRRGKAIYAELAKTKNLKQTHDNVLFWRKVVTP